MLISSTILIFFTFYTDEHTLCDTTCCTVHKVPSECHYLTIDKWDKFQLHEQSNHHNSIGASWLQEKWKKINFPYKIQDDPSFQLVSKQINRGCSQELVKYNKPNLQTVEIVSYSNNLLSNALQTMVPLSFMSD